MKKIFITGISGFLGWNCCRVAKSNYRVSGMYYSRKIDLIGVEQHQCDICDINSLRKLLKKIDPEIVIHTAAISSPNKCEENPEKTRLINVEATEVLAGICLEHQIPFIFTSSDQVFNGHDAPYSEKASPCPLNEYGRQKLEAENRILSRYDKAIVCRMPLMFGDSPKGSFSFISPWLEKLYQGEVLMLFEDEFRTPVSALDAAKGLLLAGEKVKGIIHPGGKERLSRFEMGQKLIEIAGLDPKQINECNQQDIKMAAPRPSDVSLDSSKAFSLGYTPGFFKDELKKLKIVRKK